MPCGFLLLHQGLVKDAASFCQIIGADQNYSSLISHLVYDDLITRKLFSKRPEKHYVNTIFVQNDTNKRINYCKSRSNVKNGNSD